MALKAVVDEAGFSALDEGIKALYEKNDAGVYALSIDGVDDHPAVHGLKKNHDTLIGEKKAADKARRESEAAAAAASAADAEKRGEFEQLYKSAQAKLDETLAEVEQIKGRAASEKLNSEAVKLASSLTTDAGRQTLLVEQIGKRLALTDEGVKVKDASGNLSVQTIKQLTEEIKGAYPFLVDGNKASGGGAGRQQNNGGAGSNNKLTGTPAERRAAITARFDLQS